MTGCVGNFFRYSFIAVTSFKLSPSESNKSSGVYSGVFDTSCAVWGTFFPIHGCGVARSELEASSLSLVGFH